MSFSFESSFYSQQQSSSKQWPKNDLVPLKQSDNKSEVFELDFRSATTNQLSQTDEDISSSYSSLDFDLPCKYISQDRATNYTRPSPVP